VEVLGAVPNRAQAKRWAGVQLAGEPAIDGEARYPSGVGRRSDGSGTKFCVLTRGDLSASAGMVPAVVVEDKRTRRRWDERSRRVE
jgi:hypothetical protein